MKLHVLAAVLALAVTPALAQSDTSTQAPGASDGQMMHKPLPHKKKVKKHHTKTSQVSTPSNCKHTAKAVDSKAGSCT